MGYVCGGGDIGHGTKPRLIGEQASTCTLRNSGGDATAHRLFQTKGRGDDQPQRARNLPDIQRQNQHGKYEITHHHSGDNNFGDQCEASNTAEQDDRHNPGHHQPAGQGGNAKGRFYRRRHNVTLYRIEAKADGHQ